MTNTNTNEPQKQLEEKKKVEKKNFFTKTKLLLGCGCLGACIMITCMAIGLILLSSDSYRERDEAYENDYNYGAIESPPWIYDDEELKEYEKKKEALEKLGIDLDAGFYKDVLESDSSEDKLDDSYDDYQDQNQTTGIIKNEIYSYSFEVDGSERYRQVASSFNFEGTQIDQYVYCYKLDDTSYESMSEQCNTGELEIFMISVFNEEAYDSYKQLPGSPQMLLSQDVADTYGLYFLLEHPNGVLPDEIGAFNDIIDQIRSTFTYTSSAVG